MAHTGRRFADTLTAADLARNIAHRFAVPAGTAALDLRLSYAPATVGGIHNLLSLTLLDPAGFRGSGHRSGPVHRVHLDAAAATPGYLPGRLPAGEWIASVDVHMVLPGEPCRYELEVALTPGADPEPPSPPALPATEGSPCGTTEGSPCGTTEGNPCGTTEGSPYGATEGAPPRGPGWFRGELHTHTLHSDAVWDVATLLAESRRKGLDFVALTDHNTVSGLAELDAAGEGLPLGLPGLELTTFWGHALCLGVREWIDWRVPPEGGAMADIARCVHAAGGLFVLAHPASIGNPTCTGCTWLYPELQPGPARLVEVWNGPWDCDSNNEEGLALWYGWLEQGHRLAATAGSDAHEPAHLAWASGRCVVYARELSEAAILEAIGQGRLVLSSGPQLTLASADGRAMVGDTLPAGPAELAAAWAGAPDGAWVRAVAGGRALAEWPAGGAGQRTVQVAAGRARWCTAELRARNGTMLALTNPIYLGEPG